MESALLEWPVHLAAAGLDEVQILRCEHDAEATSTPFGIPLTPPAYTQRTGFEPELKERALRGGHVHDGKRHVIEFGIHRT
jgi:hypothetical protein